MIGDILRLSKLDMNVANAQKSEFNIAGMLKELVMRLERISRTFRHKN